MAGSTGADIKRRTDGTVVKHVRGDGAAARLVGGADRMARLWQAGVFHRLPPQLDSAVVDVTATADGWQVVMRDVGPWLLEHRRTPLTTGEADRILDALALGHAALAASTVGGLCPLATWISFLAPESIRRLDGVVPIARAILAGWDRFFATAPGPVVEAVRTIHDDPTDLAEALAIQGTTILQGDLWWHNLALLPDRLVLLDWGELTTIGPPALAIVQWLAHDADKLPWSHDTFLDRAVAAHARADSRITRPVLDLAILAVTAQMGWARAGTHDFTWWNERAEASWETMR